jgi:hypothetical protein
MVLAKGERREMVKNINTMEYYSAIKTEIMSFEGKWMELEISMLSEISQTQKDMLSLIWRI